MNTDLTIRKTYSIEEAMQWLNDCNSVGIEPDMAQQLIDTMQREAEWSVAAMKLELENRRLREALEHYRRADDGVYQMLAGFKATKDMRDPNSAAGKALDQNEVQDAL